MNINFALLAPELLTVGLAFGVLVIALLVPVDQRRGLGYITSLGLIGVIATLLVMINTNESLFNGMYIVDPYSIFFKLLVVASALLVALMSSEYVEAYLTGFTSEFYSILLFATLGMMILVSAGDFITFYMALELMTISFIILVGFGKGLRKSSEAALKYILLSALSSAVLLYGLSLVYGLTKSTLIADTMQLIANNNIEPALILGIVFLLSGLTFKVSAVPFHMWTPDVYDGAPTPITAFLSVGSKGAAFAALFRFFIEGFNGVATSWMPLVITITVVTLVLGNYVAIPQTNIKRLLAYSGIAQAGYILLGLVANNESGLAAAMFYSMIYVFANLGAFAVIIAFTNATSSDEIADYSGLSQRAPMLAAVLLLCMLALGGIPPLSGFVGKFYLFVAAYEQGYFWLVVLALAMSLISVYYYLMVAKVMYLGEPKDKTPIPISGNIKLVMLIAVAVSLFLGIYPTPLTEMAASAAKGFFIP